MGDRLEFRSPRFNAPLFLKRQRQIKFNSEITYSTMNFIVLPTLKNSRFVSLLSRQNLSESARFAACSPRRSQKRRLEAGHVFCQIQ